MDQVVLDMMCSWTTAMKSYTLKNFLKTKQLENN